MTHDRDLAAQKPISLWQRPIKVEFGRLAKALGSGAIAGAFGKWDSVASSGLDAVSALGLAQDDPTVIAWVLVQRSLLQAMSDLLQDYRGHLQGQEPNFQLLCNQLDLALEKSDFVLNSSFFEQPKTLSVLTAVQDPYRRWLQTVGLAPHEAQAIAQRLPTYFVYALNQQWRQNRQDYARLQEALQTPFIQASDREQRWERYSAWLARRVDEPLFAEAFSLRQIYVPLRGYYERKNSGELAEGEPAIARRTETQVERVAVDLMSTLLDWVKRADKDDAVRVLCGGPGCGKSSFARMFAAELIDTKTLPVLLIPLHQFNLEDDLIAAMQDFIDSDFDDILPPNPLEKQYAEQRILLIFDGLDEIVMQGKGATQAVQDFVREVLKKLMLFNRNKARIMILMTGREVVVQDHRNEFRRDGQILYTMPYFQKDEDLKKFNYILDNTFNNLKFLRLDQRQHWWQKYGTLKNKNYAGLPSDLDRDNLTDITAQPLLNYLIALSYDRGELDFSERSNLNTIYADLLEQVYQRDWAGYQHPQLGNIAHGDFVRILEEVAIVCWHGDGRTATIDKIAQRCATGKLKQVLEIFQGSAQEGVTRLLTAFYFRQSEQYGGDATFEFTHKSFGEYLIIRRIIRELELMQAQLSQHRENPDIGWSEKECLRRWAELCGPTYLDRYLLKFLRDEVKLQAVDKVRAWQLMLCDLMGYMLKNGMPMEEVKACPRYLDQLRHALHAEEVLLAALSSCALVTEELSHITFSNERIFGIWLGRLLGQRPSMSAENKIVLECLNHLDLSGISLCGKELVGAFFRGSCLKDTNFEESNLRDTDLMDINLSGANFSGADLTEASLVKSNLINADFEGTTFEGADLENTNLAGALLRGANFLSANFAGANLTGAILVSANLRNITWDDQTRWIDAYQWEDAYNFPIEWKEISSRMRDSDSQNSV